MKRITLVVHSGKQTALDAASRLEQLAASRGIEVVEADDTGIDGVVAFGGDGTILRAAATAFARDVPLLGVNLGHLGFLSTVDVSHLESVVDALDGDGFVLQPRMMLDAVIYQGTEERAHVSALNEIVIERGTFSRVVTIDVTVGDDDVATYAADGFIISTPTGSTAYSLSAGGPVVEPSVEAMILTSVSAHAPLWRSIVVAPDRRVTLRMDDDKIAISADGQPVASLEPGGSVVVRPHEKRLKLMLVNGHFFYDKLRSRFRDEPNRGGTDTPE